MAGTLRNGTLYAALAARANHTGRYYRPIIGGISPCSIFTTTSASYVFAANSLVTPVTCKWNAIFLAKVSGGTGKIKVTVDSVAIETADITSTSVTTINTAYFTGTGDPEKVLIEGKCSSGETLTIYSAVFQPAENDWTGIDTDYLASTVDAVDAVAGGAPVTAHTIRRFQANPVEIMKARPAALAFHADATSRSGITPGDIIRVGNAIGKTEWSYSPNFRITILAPTATTATISAQGGSSVISPSSADVPITSATVSGFGVNVFFVGAVESYVVYEV